jgi:elongation factor Ts
MMECKNALVETKGDIEAAIENMRKSGMAKAAKKAGRVASEGRIEIKLNDDASIAAILEVNSETDFVAKDSNFKAFTQSVIDLVLTSQITDVEAISNLVIADDQTVEQARQVLVSKLGENIQIRRAAVLTSKGTLGSYTHSDRIGALVALSTPDQEVAKDVAMHIAAANPQVLNPEDVSAVLVQQEKDIFTAQSVASGKSPESIEEMISRHIDKFRNEIALTGQSFVKDPNQRVGQLLKSAKAEVTAFIRFEVGEGIEKTVEDFAEAVKAQMAGDA